MSLFLLVLLFTGIAIAWVSIIEWLAHRYVMHQPFAGFRRGFERHALNHHRIFKADETYHLVREEDKRSIRMAWWIGPAIIAGLTLPSIALGILIGLWWVIVIFVVVSVAYFYAYEYMHWCMHLPKAKRRLVERWKAFRFLNGHHLLHHRYQGKNFNVVLPLADLMFGTLILRSPRPFMQARGLSVPDVQPPSR